MKQECTETPFLAMRGGVLHSEGGSTMEFILKGLGRLGLALLPAVYSGLFVYWRYQESPWSPSCWQDPAALGLGFQAVTVAVFVVWGVLLYFLYRGVVHRVILWVQRRWVGLPQYEFHTRICDDLGVQGDIRKKIGISQACLFLTQADASVGYRSSTKSFNIGSHILYLSTLMFLLFSVHELLSKWLHLQHSPFQCWVLCIFVGLAAFSFLTGLAYDRLADFREVVFLARHENEYREIVSQLHKSGVFDVRLQSGQSSTKDRNHQGEKSQNKLGKNCLKIEMIISLFEF